VRVCLHTCVGGRWPAAGHKRLLGSSAAKHAPALQCHGTCRHTPRPAQAAPPRAPGEPSPPLSPLTPVPPALHCNPVSSVCSRSPGMIYVPMGYSLGPNMLQPGGGARRQRVGRRHVLRAPTARASPPPPSSPTPSTRQAARCSIEGLFKKGRGWVGGCEQGPEEPAPSTGQLARKWCPRGQRGISRASVGSRPCSRSQLALGPASPSLLPACRLPEVHACTASCAHGATPALQGCTLPRW
jgi:hypothetical protein